MKKNNKPCKKKEGCQDGLYGELYRNFVHDKRMSK